MKQIVKKPVDFGNDSFLSITHTVNDRITHIKRMWFTGNKSNGECGFFSVRVCSSFGNIGDLCIHVEQCLDKTNATVHSRIMWLPNGYISHLPYSKPPLCNEICGWKRIIFIWTAPEIWRGFFAIYCVSLFGRFIPEAKSHANCSPKLTPKHMKIIIISECSSVWLVEVTTFTTPSP